MELVENINELGNKISNGIELIKEQDNFLKTNIGQVINSAVDIGLKAFLPDFIENEIIDVKNSLIQGGLNEGINSAIDNAINIGKKALGLNNESLKNIEQAKSALKNGNLINGVSNSIDIVLNSLSKNKMLSENIIQIIKNGKNLILNNADKNVENDFNNQIKTCQKIEKYIENWEKAYRKKDLDVLNKEYNKIEKQMKKILPLENMINNVNKIRNLNNLINNNKDFDFSSVYLDLAKKLN